MHPLGRLCLPLLFAGCANYDFTAARLPDGTFDTQQLIADLEAAGGESLSEGIWIPLLYLDITTFGPSRQDQAEGYTLSQITSVGPVFLAGGRDTVLYDPKGATIEQRELDWLGWGLLYLGQDTRIETIVGPRFESDWRLLAVFGRSDDVTYVRPGSFGDDELVYATDRK